jgi:hypothetical protein
VENPVARDNTLWNWIFTVTQLAPVARSLPCGAFAAHNALKRLGEVFREVRFVEPPQRSSFGKPPSFLLPRRVLGYHLSG